jgi:molybdopterin-containing oxidoreductase family membrane subunit
LALVLIGVNAYARQLAHGLITTGMGDEVSWGLYIANFAFLYFGQLQLCRIHG